METDPELKKLIDEPVITRWIAHRRHIISYPINNRETYNISTAHPDEHLGTEESWTSKGSKEAMLNMWHDYCPRVQKMLHLVQADEILEWKLRVHAPLKTWIEGRVFLLGDASHPTLPHLAQGAAQAVEDGAVMATLLAKIKSTEEVPAILALVEVRSLPIHTLWHKNPCLTSHRTFTCHKRKHEKAAQNLSWRGPLMQERQCTLPPQRRLKRVIKLLRLFGPMVEPIPIRLQILLLKVSAHDYFSPR